MEKEMKYTVGVIGGGPSGMMAAITAAKAGAKVTILEGNDRLGKKILVTGNGRCNLGNLKLSGKDYEGGSRRRVEEWLSVFGVKETLAFFEKAGLMIKDRNGYLYPVCDQASAVLDILRLQVAGLGITVLTQAKVTDIRILQEKRGSKSFEVSWQGGRQHFDRVILSCGSKAAPKTGSDGSGYMLAEKLGLKVTPIVPALTALKCQEEFCKSLAGVRVEARIRILSKDGELACEEGELQLTDYGISGIPVFQLSGRINQWMHTHKGKQAPLCVKIDFFPGMEEQEYESMTSRRLNAALNTAMTVEEFCTGMLHKKIMLLLIRLAGLKPSHPLRQAEKSSLKKLFSLCREFPMHIVGSNSFDNAQICSGGVALTEVTESLEAVKCPGLFLTGELLDVDGRCGGYNLQWAWTSGYIAGSAVAGLLPRRNDQQEENCSRQKREQEEPGKKQKCQRNKTSQRNLAGKETKGIKKQNEQKNRIGAEPVRKRQYRKRGIT